jgi:MinD-like ATPase involved in chromosome partitioning or flagellar assembly
VTKIIAVSNRRGGVGKTTITMMLAYGLAVARRQKVLLIDLDARRARPIARPRGSWRRSPTSTSSM